MGTQAVTSLKHWLSAILLVAVTVPALAERDLLSVRNLTPGELALTPAFCQDVQAINGWTKEKGSRSPRAEHWLGLMGETFWAMHHYCWGLIKMHRARLPGLTPQLRTALRRDAIEEYRYVLNHAPKDFVMLPEVYLRIGESYAALNEHPVALLSFAEARSLKADYWPAYSAAAESLLALGQRDEARRMVQQGLGAAPGNEALSRLAERLETAKPGTARAARP